MAITLLRRQSDVPTVQGQDDSRMMRYAVVHDGVTRGYQSECGYSTSGSTFTVLGGEIIVDGWQAIIDSLGCAVQAISSSTKMYYIVYVEYDLRIPDQQSVTIKSTYASGTFPVITPGDDLTENPNGLRRLALYRFTIQNGVISGVERLFSYCEVGDSKNVTTSINGKAITSIFESDGMTAKKATHAEMTEKIKMVKITPDNLSLPLLGSCTISEDLVEGGNYLVEFDTGFRATGVAYSSGSKVRVDLISLKYLGDDGIEIAGTRIIGENGELRYSMGMSFGFVGDGPTVGGFGGKIIAVYRCGQYVEE